MMKKGKEKRLLAEAHLESKIDESFPSRLGPVDGTFLVLKDIRELMTEMVNNQREQLGREPLPERDPLPVPETRGGRRNWLWPNRKNKS